jgi:uncharacterized protein involved in exopolysaccharide biosynthesis
MENDKSQKASNIDAFNDLTKFDVSVLLVTLRRSLFFIFVFASVVFLASGGVAWLLIKNQYKANCLLIANSKNISRQTDVPYLYQEFSISTAVDLVKSSNNLEKAAEKLNLKESPGALGGCVKVEKGRSDIIKISVTYGKPELAADIANTLAEVFTENFVRTQNRAAQAVHDYYKKYADTLRKENAVLEDKLRVYMTEHNLISPDTQITLKFQQLNEIELKKLNSLVARNDLSVKIKELEKIIGGMRDDIMLYYIVSSSDAKQLQDMSNELKALRQRYTEDNPKVKQIMADMDNLRTKAAAAAAGNQSVPQQITYGENQLKKSLEIEKFRAGADLTSAVMNTGEYDKIINSIKDELKSFLDKKSGFFSLNSEIEANRSLLKITETRMAEALMAMGSNTGDLEIVERAATPRNPEISRKKFITVAGGVIGFMLAVMFVLARELSDMTVKSKFDFDNIIRMEMSGCLPDRNDVSDQVFYAAFQSFFERLRHLLGQSEKSFLAFGSDRDDTGKSFIIENYIEMLRGKNLKTLYISCVSDVPGDIKDYVINDFLHNPDAAGGEPKFNMISETHHRAYLHINPDLYRRIIEDDSVRKFIAKLKGFDQILWEIFEFRENAHLFTTIASVADMSIVVCGFRVSNKFDIKNIVDLMRKNGVRNVTGVLNLVSKHYFNRTI